MSEKFSISDRRISVVDTLEIPQMDFGAAMSEALKGRHVRRLEWPDRKARLALVDDQLMIFKPETDLFHPLVISSGDIAGADWVVTEEAERTIN